MGIPFPVFNIPILSSLIELGNKILETNQIDHTDYDLNFIPSQISDSSTPHFSLLTEVHTN